MTARLRHVVMALFSCVAGVMTFMMLSSWLWTLTLETRSLDAGVGHVRVQRPDGIVRDLSFSVKGGNGEKSLTVIELPRGRWESLMLAPLAAPGRFAMDRVTLSRDGVTYRWNEIGDCTQRTLRDGKVVNHACESASPVLLTGPNGSVDIRSIPDGGMKPVTATRIIAALTVSALMFITLLWRTTLTQSAGSAWLMTTADMVWIGVMLVFVWHLMLICNYSVDVPYHDDWHYFEKNTLTREFPWQWIHEFYNEHRILPTKLMAWLNLELLGMDFAAQKVVNFLLFGGVIASIALLKNRLLGRGEFPLFPLFLLFLLSPIAYENHRWGFQSQFHFFILFSNLSLCYAFRLKESKWFPVSFCLLAVAAMYSFSAGVILTFCCIGFMIVHTLACAPVEGRNPREVRRLLVVCGVMILILFLWHHGYQKRPDDEWSQEYVMPYRAEFWDYFLNLLSYSFGFETESIVPGVVILILLVCPGVYLLKRPDTRLMPATWTLAAAISGVLLVLTVISMSRTYLNFFGSKTSRYAEIGFLLIPYMAMAWWLLLRGYRAQRFVLSMLWLACCISYMDDWSPQVYRETRQVDGYTLECVENYFSGTGDGVCQGRTTPFDLDRAKSLDAKFTRQFLSTRDGGR